MWSYTGNPQNNPVDAVRLLIGDTDQDDPQMQDGEIQYFLADYNNSAIMASARCAETLISKFSRLVDEGVGAIKVAYSQRAIQYEQLRVTLRNRIALEETGAYAGGVSLFDIATNDLNTDIPEPDFTKHIQDNNQQSPWINGGSSQEG